MESSEPSLTDKVETFIRRVRDNYYEIHERADQIPITVIDKGVSVEGTLASHLASAMTNYEINKNTPQREEYAKICIAFINDAFIRKLVRISNGLPDKLDESRELVAKLKQAIEALAKERDGWKRRYEDCERLRSGFTETSDVEGS